MKNSLLGKTGACEIKTIEINEYGSAPEILELSYYAKMPDLPPNEVLIQNKAACVNPIDALKRIGFGRTIFAKKRPRTFQWILGSDAAGVVEKVGERVTRGGKW